MPYSMWNLPGPGIEPMSSTLAGRLLPMGLPGNSHVLHLNTLLIILKSVVLFVASYPFPSPGTHHERPHWFRFCLQKCNPRLPRSEVTGPSVLTFQQAVTCDYFILMRCWCQPGSRNLSSSEDLALMSWHALRVSSEVFLASPSV